MAKIMDPKPTAERLQKYVSWAGPFGPSLHTCTGEIHRFTRWERFRLWLGTTTLRKIDRYFVRRARFDARRRKMQQKIKRGVELKPKLQTDPRTRQPVLFTSRGTVYNLSYIERLLMRFGQLTLQELDARVAEKELEHVKGDVQHGTLRH